MTQSELMLSTGLLEFESLEGMRLYLRSLLKHFELEADAYSEKVGTLMRVRERQEKRSKNPDVRLSEQNWRKTGALHVNARGPMLGMLEILLEALEDYKAKSARTSEVLLKFDELEELEIPRGQPFTLYVRNGVPLRIVIGGPETLQQAPEAGRVGQPTLLDPIQGTLKRLGI